MVNMDINAFDDKALVVKTKMDTFAIVEKINYDPEKESKITPSILGTSLVNNSEVDISLKLRKSRLRFISKWKMVQALLL
jgi:hypothetical protein